MNAGRAREHATKRSGSLGAGKGFCRDDASAFGRGCFIDCRAALKIELGEHAAPK